MTIPEDQVSELFRKLDEMKDLTTAHITKSELFRAECNRSFCDISDQIKGNPDKEIKGIRPQLIEMKEKQESDKKELQAQITDLNHVSVVQLTVRKQLKKLNIFQWVGLIALVIDAIADGAFKMGVFSFITFIFHHFPK